MDKTQLKSRLEYFLEIIKNLGGDTRELIFEEPAKEEDVKLIEDQLGYGLPEEFRQLLLNISSHVEFRWFLPDDLKLPDELRQIFSGELHWGVKFIIDFNESKDGWLKECFPNPDDDYDKVWHNKFVFQEVGNGDYLSIDLSKDNYGKIIYLSHDDGDGHGYLMANNLEELLNNWVEIGCPGSEDWQWIPFVNDKVSGIMADSQTSNLWKATIRMN